MRSSAAWKFKFPRRGGWSQSDLLPGYFMLEGNRFRSSVFTYIKLVVGIPARDGWKKFSLSGTGQTKLVILCKRCCVSGGKRLQIETASVFALCGSWILLPPCSYLFPSDFRTNVCGLWNFGVKGFEHRRKSSFSEDTHTQVVIIRNDSNKRFYAFSCERTIVDNRDPQWRGKFVVLWKELQSLVINVISTGGTSV